MRTEYNNEPIYAKECFDASISKKSDTAFFCPFNINSGEFSWIDETLMEFDKGKYFLTKFKSYKMILHSIHSLRGRRLMHIAKR